MNASDIFFLFGLLYIIYSTYTAIIEALNNKKDDTDYNLENYIKMNPGQGIAFIKKHLNFGLLFTFLYFSWVFAGLWSDQQPLFIALALMPTLTLIIMQGKDKESKNGKAIMTIDFIINKFIILIILFRHFYNVF